MEKIEFTINNEHGMHARPAGQMVSLASQFQSSVTVIKNDKSASAKGLFGLMGLGINSGEAIEIQIDGKDERDAYSALVKFLEENFSNKGSN